MSTASHTTKRETTNPSNIDPFSSPPLKLPNSESASNCLLLSRPGWHCKPSNEIYELTNTTLEEYDSVTDFDEDNGRRWSDWELGWMEWSGYVRYPESGERSTISKETEAAKKGRNEEGHPRVEREKRVRQR